MSAEKNKLRSIIDKRSSEMVMSPFILVLFAIALVLTGIITAAFGNKFGYYQGFHASEENMKLNGDMQSMTADDIKELNLKIESLNNAVNEAKQERDLSLSNIDKMRKRVEEGEIAKLQLAQENELYAQALAKQEGLPLKIVGAEIKPLPENAFEYRFDVAMLAADGRPRQLVPKLTLLDESSLVKVPLTPSSYDIRGVARIRGRFVMPKGFTPKQVKLRLSASDEKLEQIYNWRLSSTVKDMPLSLAEVPEIDQRPIQ